MELTRHAMFTILVRASLRGCIDRWIELLYVRRVPFEVSSQQFSLLLNAGVVVWTAMGTRMLIDLQVAVSSRILTSNSSRTRLADSLGGAECDRKLRFREEKYLHGTLFNTRRLIDSSYLSVIFQFKKQVGGDRSSYFLAFLAELQLSPLLFLYCSFFFLDSWPKRPQLSSFLLHCISASEFPFNHWQGTSRP